MRMSGWIRTTLAVVGLLTVTSAAQAGVIIVGKYYEDTASNVCAGSINCSLTHSAIPAATAVLFARIACSIRVTKTTQLLRVELGLARTGQLPTRFQDLKFQDTVAANSLQRFYVVESDLHYLLGVGAKPFVRVLTTANSITNIDCQIVGEKN